MPAPTICPAPTVCCSDSRALLRQPTINLPCSPQQEDTSLYLLRQSAPLQQSARTALFGPSAPHRRRLPFPAGNAVRADRPQGQHRRGGARAQPAHGATPAPAGPPPPCRPDQPPGIRGPLRRAGRLPSPQPGRAGPGQSHRRRRRLDPGRECVAPHLLVRRPTIAAHLQRVQISTRLCSCAGTEMRPRPRGACLGRRR